MKPTQVHPEAKAEMKDALNWYWKRSEFAALRFDFELKETLGTLRRNPNACSPYLRGTRRVMVHRYPYFVVFRELPRKIQIIAVAHAKRRPNYWTGRL